MQSFFNCPALRKRLALYRLALLFIIACYLAVETGLLWRTDQDTGQGLAIPRPTVDQAGDAPLPFFGINVMLEQYTPAQRQAALDSLHQTGFGWVRQRIDWGLIEPQPGRYSWQMSDAIVAAITAHGLVPVLVLDGSPAWARAPQDTGATDNPFVPPADPTTFAHFAATVAQRYLGKVRFYQIWDEPNIAPHWGNQRIEPFAYAQLLKSTTPAIRAVAPDAQIIAAALAPTQDRGHLAIDEVYFLQRLYAAGAAAFFDVVATQPFGFGNTPDDPRARLEILNFQRVKLIRRAMLAAGDGAKPIWAVRYGWNRSPNSPWRTVRPADQITFATTALTLTRQQWPWLTAMGWAIDQPTQPRTDPTWGFALTPALREAMQTWHSTDRDLLAATPQPSNNWYWTLLLGGWLLLGWRTGAALHILPWSQWHQSYTAQPTWRKGINWLAVVGVYYVAAWPPLIALGWVAIILLISLSPNIGLGLVALSLPFYFQHKELQLVSGIITIPPAHAALLCLWLALLTTWQQAFPRVSGLKILARIKQLHAFDWLALAWIGISLLASVNVWYWPAYRQGFMEFVLLPCLAYGAVRLLITTPARQTHLVIALFLGGLGVALIGLVMWAQGKGTFADGVLRLVGPYFSPNHTALYLERTLWLGLGLALTQQSARRHWLLLATGIIGIALGLTASRGALLLGIPAGALIFMGNTGLRQWQQGMTVSRWAKWWSRRGSLRWVIGGIVAIAGACYWLDSAALSPLWERFTNSSTISERITIWQATLQLWQDQWLVGVGPGGFFWRYPSYLPWQAHSDPNLLHPHNLWLELLAGWGMLGLLWFMLILWQLGKMYYSLKAEPATKAQETMHWQWIGIFAALAAGIAHSQVDAFTALPDLALWHWLVWGLLVNGAIRQTADPAIP